SLRLQHRLVHTLHHTGRYADRARTLAGRTPGLTSAHGRSNGKSEQARRGRRAVRQKGPLRRRKPQTRWIAMDDYMRKRDTVGQKDSISKTARNESYAPRSITVPGY